MRRRLSIAILLVTGLALVGCTPSETASNLPPEPGTPPPAAPHVADAPPPRLIERGHVYLVRRSTGVDTAYVAVSAKEHANPETGRTFLGAPMSVLTEQSPTVVVLGDTGSPWPRSVHCDEVESVLVDEVTRDLGSLGAADVQRVDAGLRAALGLESTP
jgi:mRNA-degrading endonuclease toxin of MazEF toxin-antitoxin module